jgi:hypothetical protein
MSAIALGEQAGRIAATVSKQAGCAAADALVSMQAVPLLPLGEHAGHIAVVRPLSPRASTRAASLPRCASACRRHRRRQTLNQNNDMQAPPSTTTKEMKFSSISWSTAPLYFKHMFS